ncbi:TetR/AcrR family transcriptional regulator [Sphingomonas faeni]|uniref:TetR/AcrR family transcriptional regulator n=1 Tax=Sphingomonas faeni TaxID=185950 RepID=UPI00278A8E27|nr:TetR/AcrR family transcriptional regulator [Sphingomonas faeni]MDQ0839984.1 AcrR family transcriptional regulator [Sphingomonas faeni]
MRSDARLHRETLIAAAARIFERDGYDVPLKVVLDETGLGRGTLYRHFGDRRGLIVAVMEHEHEKLAAFVDEHAESPNLLIEFVRRQGRLSILALPFLRSFDRQEVLKLVAPLSASADILNARVMDQAKRMGIVDARFDGSDLRLINRMLIAATSVDSRQDEGLFERAVRIVLTGVARL